MLFTPAVLAVLVDDRHDTVARELAFARSVALRRTVAGFVHRIGAGITTLGNVLDEEPGAGHAVTVDPRRGRAR